MIIDRRKTHFFSFIALAIILPIIFFIGVIFIPEYPLVDNSATELFQFSQTLTTQNNSSKKLVNSQTLSSKEISLLAEIYGDNQSFVLQIKPLSTIKIPEPLVYWQKGNDSPEMITENSILLGSLSGKSIRVFNLLPEMSNHDGKLIIYSQGYQEIVAFFPFKKVTS